MITLEHVVKRFEGGALAVDDLSLEIEAGQLVVLVGPSGCGKTTTLKMINRLIEPSGGVIRIGGRDTRELDGTALRRGIGYVIQQVGLFPHLTVAQNVATVPRLLGWDRRRTAARVEELLELVGMPATEFADRMPHELSGGQRQRVGVARALGIDPPVLLMDEPFSAIDPVTRLRLQEELLRLQSVIHKTIVFVTHDIDEATRLGDRVALLEVGGRLAQYSAPAELLGRPASPFVEQFLGAGRMVRRLALIPLRQVPLLALGATSPPVAQVGAAASLREGLDVVLRARDGRAAVMQDGMVLGVLDIEQVRAAAAVDHGADVHAAPVAPAPAQR